MNGENYINNVPTHRVYNNAWINTELHYISIRGRGADPEPSYKKTRIRIPAPEENQIRRLERPDRDLIFLFNPDPS